MNFMSFIYGPQVHQIMIQDCKGGNYVIFMVDTFVNDKLARISSVTVKLRKKSLCFVQSNGKLLATYGLFIFFFFEQCNEIVEQVSLYALMKVVI